MAYQLFRGSFFIVQLEAFFQKLAYGFGAVREALFMPVILNPLEQVIRENHCNNWLFSRHMIYSIKNHRVGQLNIDSVRVI